MTVLNELSPNELFRFVHVRGPLQREESPRRQSFVPLVYGTTTAAEKEGSARLYPSLERARGAPKQLDESLKLIKHYRAGPDFIGKADDYANAFPELGRLVGWLDANADTATTDAIISKIEAELGARPKKAATAASFRDAQERIWDNLFANLFAADDPSLVTMACKYLGVLNLLELLADGQAPVETPGTAYRARPLLPKWIVTLALSIDRKPDAGIDTEERKVSDAGAKTTEQYRGLVAAVSDLERLLERRRAQVREHQAAADAKQHATKDLRQATVEPGARPAPSERPPVDANPDLLRVDAAALKTLAKDTVRLLVEHLGDQPQYDAAQALDLFRQMAVVLGPRLAALSQTTVVKVGGAVIESSAFCADMTDQDPCARRPRVMFESRGSFVTSTLIGDLLVTKQQLVKYDLGEVAHVEHAMAGLQKERTHRRLHRTEETDIFETTSVTEEERETQTTDRFDMEKESSKTLEQNFQIDAGVNVTGSYGTVNFTTSLDTSYGNSSSQAESEATSFSRNVTNRALSRVKQSVRRSKTVTILNEMEETSVNTLTNATSDHINGVYRWLDKFYLNKIINYGKRLMFEFAVPEPAHFYVFRRMAKPQTGQSVSRPVEPREAADPTGATLRSPTDLTDTNYAYWTSLYGANGVEPPPPLFVRTSESWKNVYGTSQSGDIYDSFNAAMKLPENYEAVMAQMYCDNYWWGTSDIHGVIATSGFGPGYSTAALPNISTSLAIGLLSTGMNWKLNVVVTCQRSAQLFGKWQIKTYGAIMDAYGARLREYEAWIADQTEVGDGAFRPQGNNPDINRATEREELKKRCLELFTGQRFESFDAAVNGVFNVSGYPEILFAEAVREGNIVKFFEQAFDWPNMTYIFYPYFWGRKPQWVSTLTLNDAADPLFTKFLQAGYARVVVPVRPEFENYLMLFHMLSDLVSTLGCGWNFDPKIFGQLGISNTFSPAIDDPTYISVAQELQSAAGFTEVDGPIYGTPYVQKVPTNLVYIAQNSHVTGAPWPGLPDNSADPEIAPYI